MNDIPFFKPDIGELEIQEVVDTLRGGWITTGPKTLELERILAEYCSVERVLCLSSATAGLDLLLHFLDIGEGDEVITSPYTFASTAHAILHVGAKPIFVDVNQDFHLDSEKLSESLTRKTKLILPVDFAGLPVEYGTILSILKENRSLYQPKKGTKQEYFDRIPIVSDSAHSLGASYEGKKIGSVADFTVFSFHAVKNITTAEGGAIAFGESIQKNDQERFYQQLKKMSLHGQSKDAWAKQEDWRYSIEMLGYKCNMTDLSASVGLAQLRRYEDEILPRRKKQVQAYIDAFQDQERLIIPTFQTPNKESSYHLFALRIRDYEEEDRCVFLSKMKSAKIQCNVHFIPIPMHPVYQKLGFSIQEFPKTYEMYKNEVTLPLYAALQFSEIEYISSQVKRYMDG